MDRKRIDQMSQSLTDELFALAILHEMIESAEHDLYPMLEMCRDAVERCRQIAAVLSSGGAIALQQAVAPVTLHRAN